MAFKMKGPFFFKKHKHKESDHDFVHEGKGDEIEIIREDLEEGVLGEAENGKVVKVDTSVEQGSDKEKEVVLHELYHLFEMEEEDEDTGETLLAYDESSVTDNVAGKTYTRKDGKLIDNASGITYSEGDKRLPHEKRAFAISNKAKSALSYKKSKKKKLKKKK